VSLGCRVRISATRIAIDAEPAEQELVEVESEIGEKTVYWRRSSALIHVGRSF